MSYETYSSAEVSMEEHSASVVSDSGEIEVRVAHKCDHSTCITLVTKHLWALNVHAAPASGLPPRVGHLGSGIWLQRMADHHCLRSHSAAHVISYIRPLDLLAASVSTTD
jgi:hypothetical protein